MPICGVPAQAMVNYHPKTFWQCPDVSSIFDHRQTLHKTMPSKQLFLACKQCASQSRRRGRQIPSPYHRAIPCWDCYDFLESISNMDNKPTVTFAKLIIQSQDDTIHKESF